MVGPHVWPYAGTRSAWAAPFGTCVSSSGTCVPDCWHTCANVGGGEAGWSLRFGSVAGSLSSGVELARVHLACGRIAGGARAIAEAHRFGAAEGPHHRLWDAQYHAEAVRVYGESLPGSYQRDIASLFHHSAETMAAQTIPAGLAEDWVIVTGYMRNASAAIMDWLSSRPAEPPTPGVVETPQIDDRTPMVIRFDRLAELAGREGARRLERAAVAVQHHVGAPPVLALDQSQRRLLSEGSRRAPPSSILPTSSATRAVRCTGSYPNCGRRSACPTGSRQCARPSLRASSTEPIPRRRRSCPSSRSPGLHLRITPATREMSVQSILQFQEISYSTLRRNDNPFADSLHSTIRWETATPSPTGSPRATP